MEFLNQHRIAVGAESETPFKRADGIRQDGTMAMYRDTDGTLWTHEFGTRQHVLGNVRG